MAEAHAEKHHDYHLVNPSPWPVVGAIFAFTIAVGGVVWMRSMGGGAGLFGLKGPSVFAVGGASALGAPSRAAGAPPSLGRPTPGINASTVITASTGSAYARHP